MPNDFYQKIYLVVPRLIEQSTWGGKFILKEKGWLDRSNLKNLLIGQSYELYSKINLRNDLSSSLDPSFGPELAYGGNSENFSYSGDSSKLIPLEKLINNNPEAILGKKTVTKFGKIMKTLVKFTQAKGNSFQLHVKNDTPIWKAKPESWYYLKPGLLTLGVVKKVDWSEYQNCCQKIEKEIDRLVEQIKIKKLSVEIARKISQKIVREYNPWQYVNLVKAQKGQIIDLSLGGLHHSWEEDNKNYPAGNIVYELCLDVADSVSTLRAFDGGKIKDDGTVRKLNINDYFRYIDRSEKTNNPQNHLIKPRVLLSKPNIQAEVLLRTKYYCLDRLVIAQKYKEKLRGSFHHLFVSKGKVEITSQNNRLELTSGHSCFIPQAVDNYTIESVNLKSEILKTFIA